MSKEYDIYEIIEKKDEAGLKKATMIILTGIVDGELDKDETSYWPDFLVTIPDELGLKDEFVIKDAVLNEAIDMISNFEGDTAEEARKKSAIMLKRLEGKK